MCTSQNCFCIFEAPGKWSLLSKSGLQSICLEKILFAFYKLNINLLSSSNVMYAFPPINALLTKVFM